MNPKRVALIVCLGLAVVVGGFFALSKLVAFHPMRFQGKSAEEWREELSCGDAVRSNGANAILLSTIIPGLSDAALHDTNDSRLKLVLATALNDLPGLRVTFLTAPARRGDAVKELGKFGPAAKAAIPVLDQILKGKDEAPRSAAATALGEIHSDPDVSIPALIACLEDSDINDQAAESLGKFGPLARAAVPKILPLLHGGKEARRAAKIALPEIDPEAAAKAGLKTRKIKSP